MIWDIIVYIFAGIGFCYVAAVVYVLLAYMIGSR